MVRIVARAALFALALNLPAFAQDASLPASIPFEGGTFTIAENDDYEKVLTYDGQEIARNYVLFHERTVDVGGIKVALFAVGDGGNQCGPATVIVWKLDGTIRDQAVGEECGAPPAAVSDGGIYFVPDLLPGDTAPVQYWSPEAGLRTAGALTFTPQPDTGWQTFASTPLEYIVDAFDNAAVYEAAKALLGPRLTEVVTGLLTGGSAQTQADGTVTGSGCVPHACGTADSFMAVDPKARKVYFAQQGDGPQPDAWPALDRWPKTLRAAMAAALVEGR